MAVKLTDEFGSRANPSSAEYPNGSLKDETDPGKSNDGSPLSSRVGNDFQGFMQSALSEAGIDANGNPDSVDNPQILDAIKKVQENQAKSYSKISYKSVADMISGSPIVAGVGDRCSTGGTDWERIASNGDINDFKPIGWVFIKDFGRDSASIQSAFDCSKNTIFDDGAFTVDTPVTATENSIIYVNKDAKITKSPSLMNNSFIIIGDNCIVEGWGIIDGNFRNMDKLNNNETMGNAIRVGSDCLIKDITMIDTESSHIASSGINKVRWASGLRVVNVAFGKFVDHCVYTSGLCDDIDVQARCVISTGEDNPREAFKVRGEIGNVVWRDCPYIDIPNFRGNLFVVENDNVTGSENSFGTVTIRNFNYVKTRYLGQVTCKDTTTALPNVIIENVNFTGTADNLADFRSPVRTSGNLYGCKRLTIRKCNFTNTLPQSFYQKDSFTMEKSYWVKVEDCTFESDIPLGESDVDISVRGGTDIKYEYLSNTHSPNFTVRFKPGWNASVLNVRDNSISRVNELIYPTNNVDIISVRDNRDVNEASRQLLDVNGVSGSYTLNSVEILDNTIRQTAAVGTTVGALSGTVTYLKNDPNQNVILYPDGMFRSVGTTAERPNNASIGFRYFDTTLNIPTWYSGSGQWVNADGDPK
mgnify:CR=1 FL=1